MMLALSSRECTRKRYSGEVRNGDSGILKPNRVNIIVRDRNVCYKLKIKITHALVGKGNGKTQTCKLNEFITKTAKKFHNDLLKLIITLLSVYAVKNYRHILMLKGSKDNGNLFDKFAIYKVIGSKLNKNV